MLFSEDIPPTVTNMSTIPPASEHILPRVVTAHTPESRAKRPYCRVVAITQARVRQLKLYSCAAECQLRDVDLASTMQTCAPPSVALAHFALISPCGICARGAVGTIALSPISSSLEADAGRTRYQCTSVIPHDIALELRVGRHAGLGQWCAHAVFVLEVPNRLIASPIRPSS